MTPSPKGAPASSDPVYAVRLPVNRPFTGHYALIQPVGEKGFPTFEDHILIRRRLAQKFEAALSVYVPFDEEPLSLWDNPEVPDQVVLYHRFYLAFSTDAGATFRGLTPAQKEATGCCGEGRWSEIGIVDACIRHGSLHVRTCGATRHTEDGPPSTDIELTTWKIPIDDEGAGIPLSTELLAAVGTPLRSHPDDDPDALLRTDGRRLWARWSSTERFAPVPLLAIVKTLSEKGRVDFFGGSGARTIL